MNRAVFLGSLMILFASVGLPGCGGSSPDGATVGETNETGMLRPVFSAAELEGLLSDSQQDATSGGVPAGSVALLPKVDATLFSNAYPAEAGDENYARYDGRYRYVAPGFTRAAPGAIRIQEFALDDTTPNYTGFVEVPGSLWLDGQRDFHPSESQVLLRVMTAEYTQDHVDASGLFETASGDTARYARNGKLWSTSWPTPEQQVRGLL
ncbi:MAG TPA: hypothetical protein VK624_17145 [Steroidobacteraceae bacterium]|nr:hypothetical protein [Steroidobacteraceae bacterium]